MIRINLLESITDKPTSAAVIVEQKVSNPASRFYLLSGVIAGLLVLGIIFDYLWASSTKAAADQELAKQQEIAKELEAVQKEQAELDRKIKDVDDRIQAIKDLRANQAGPSAVLHALSERIVNAPGLYLESVEQKGNQLTVKGSSPNEMTVTNFGRSLEFSSGLFTNLNIETQLKDMKYQIMSPGDNTGLSNGGAPAPADLPKLQEVAFTIKCDYTPSKAAQQSPLPNGQSPAIAAPAANRAPNSTAAATSPASSKPTEIASN